MTDDELSRKVAEAQKLAREWDKAHPPRESPDKPIPASRNETELPRLYRRPFSLSQAASAAMLQYGLLLQGMSQPRVLPALRENGTSYQQGAYTHFNCN